MIVTSSQIEYKGQHFRFLVDNTDIHIYDMNNNILASLDKETAPKLVKELSELLSVAKELHE